jgi:hypothetical protein
VKLLAQEKFFVKSMEVDIAVYGRGASSFSTNNAERQRRNAERINQICDALGAAYLGVGGIS